MRILHVIPSLQLGGAERLSLDICQELSTRKEHEVMLVTLQEKVEHDISRVNFPIKSIDSIYIPSITGKPTVRLSNWEKLVESFKPDVIHSHLFMAEMATRYHLYPHVKYFSHCHDNMHQLQKPSFSSLFNKEKLTKLYERNWILKQYQKANNHFIAISRDTLFYFQNNLPSNFHPKITWLPNAINTGLFEFPDRTYNSNFPKKLISIGSLIERKNHTFLLDVVKHLTDQSFSVNLQILGRGNELANLEQKIKNLGLEGIVSIDSSPNVAPYLRQADLYVHVAKNEPFGLVLVEAEASGLPLISLDGKGNRDLIENGKNGFLIPDENIQLFVDKIRFLLSNPADYQKFSQQAALMSKTFDIKLYVDKLIELYLKS